MRLNPDDGPTCVLPYANAEQSSRPRPALSAIHRGTRGRDAGHAYLVVVMARRSRYTTEVGALNEFR